MSFRAWVGRVALIGALVAGSGGGASAVAQAAEVAATGAVNVTVNLTGVDGSATRYPIVLVHGMMGFDRLKLGWMGDLPYWRGIVEALEADGARVHVVQVSAFNASEVRGEQLLPQVERILKETGAQKVHLIGHSHGSQTSRYVAGKRPEWVASVTSVAGPNAGSSFGDWMQEQVREDSWSAAAILGLGRWVARFIDWATDTQWPQDVPAALASLHTEGAADFNRRFPAGVPKQPCGPAETEVQGVRYYSWSGVGTFYRVLNPADPVMWLTGLAFGGEANDGLVGRCSSHLGEVIQDDLPMNHFHIVNQIAGLVDESADPVAMYVAHARRLKALGM